MTLLPFQVINSPEAQFWKDAIKSEKCNTWVLVDSPPGAKAIACKGILKKNTIPMEQ